MAICLRWCTNALLDNAICIMQRQCTLTEEVWIDSGTLLLLVLLSKWIKVVERSSEGRGAPERQIRREESIGGSRRSILSSEKRKESVHKASMCSLGGAHRLRAWAGQMERHRWPMGLHSRDESIMLGCMMYDTGARHPNDSSSATNSAATLMQPTLRLSSSHCRSL